jgi:hypothetical protein
MVDKFIQLKMIDNERLGVLFAFLITIYRCEVLVEEPSRRFELVSTFPGFPRTA